MKKKNKKKKVDLPSEVYKPSSFDFGMIIADTTELYISKQVEITLTFIQVTVV